MVGNKQGNILSLLQEEKSPTQIKRATGLSRKTIWKHTRRYLAQGLIEKLARGRYRKAIPHKCYHPIEPLALITIPPIILPVKFGGIFAQTGKPALHYDEYGKAYDEEKEFYKAQFGKHKTQIWLLSGFQGASVQERIESGHQLLLHIAHKLAVKYGITLTHLRWYENIEWVEVSKESSKETAKGAKIRKGKSREVAGAIHKFSDYSHPDQFQFNPKPGGVPVRATDHAAIHEQVYSGEYERRFEILMETAEKHAKIDNRFAKNLKLHLNVLTEIKEAIKKEKGGRLI